MAIAPTRNNIITTGMAAFIFAKVSPEVNHIHHGSFHGVVPFLLVAVPG